MEKLVYYDLETGNLFDPGHAESIPPIVQIAAVAVNAETLRELEVFERKIEVNLDDPRISRESLQKNSFDPLVWKHKAKPARQVANEFADYLRRHATVDMRSKRTGRPYQVARLVAHNGACFDGPILRGWYREHELFLPAHPQVFDTLQLAFWMFERDKQLTPPRDYKLGTLCEYFGVVLKEEEAHDALVDVRATANLYRAIQARSVTLTADQASYVSQVAFETGKSFRSLLNAAIVDLAKKEMSTAA